MHASAPRPSPASHPSPLPYSPLADCHPTTTQPKTAAGPNLPYWQCTSTRRKPQKPVTPSLYSICKRHYYSLPPLPPSPSTTRPRRRVACVARVACSHVAQGTAFSKCQAGRCSDGHCRSCLSSLAIIPKDVAITDSRSLAYDSNLGASTVQ